jgi:hypothetical protein
MSSSPAGWAQVEPFGAKGAKGAQSAKSAKAANFCEVSFLI